MKLIELIHKHPFLTFFIVDEVLVTIQNCVYSITNAQFENKEPKSVKILNKVIKAAEDVATEVKSDSSEETEDEDE